MPKGYALSEVLAKHFPRLKIVDVDNQTDASRPSSKDVQISCSTHMRCSTTTSSARQHHHRAIDRPVTSAPIICTWRHRKPMQCCPSILGKAEAISPQEALRIYDRWLGTPPPRSRDNLNLDDAERQWLKDHPIRVRVDKRWPPYDFIDDNGQAQGLSVEVLRMISSILASKSSSNQGWTQALSDITAKQIDVIVRYRGDSRRHPFMLFSEPISHHATWSTHVKMPRRSPACATSMA